MSDFARLEEMVQKHMEAAQVPGLALAIIQGESVPFARGFGRTHLEGGTAVTPETLFRVGSVAKVLTAAVIMRLPDLSPGKTGLYSNPGISLAGYIAEAVTGVRFPELMRTYLFEPLGMNRTVYDPAEAIVHPVAVSHRRLPDGSLAPLPKHTYVTYHNPEGGGYASLQDLIKFVQLHLSGGQGLLSRDSIAEMQKLHADYYTTPGSGYGLCWELTTYKGVRLAWKDGMLDQYATWIYLLPDQKTGIVMMCSRGGGFFGPAEEIVHAIIDQLFGLPESEAEPVAMEPDQTGWDRRVGAYVGPWTGLVQIETVDGRPMIALNRGPTVELHKHGEDRYFGRTPEGELIFIGFLPEAEGPTQFVMLNSIPCERIAGESQVDHLSADALETYAGLYRSTEMQLHFWVSDGVLRMGRPGDEAGEPCSPLDQHRFWAEGAVVEFTLDAKGQVVSVNTDRTDLYVRVRD